MNYDVNTILYALISLGFLAYFAPRVFAMNRGVALRNIGLWIAAFALLGLFYKNFGPESERPLFQLPESMAARQQAWQKAKEAKEQASQQKQDGEEASRTDNQQNIAPNDIDADKPSDVMKGI